MVVGHSEMQRKAFSYPTQYRFTDFLLKICRLSYGYIVPKILSRIGGALVSAICATFLWMVVMATAFDIDDLGGCPCSAQGQIVNEIIE
jgi:hypothetical protein